MSADPKHDEAIRQLKQRARQFADQLYYCGMLNGLAIGALVLPGAWKLFGVVIFAVSAVMMLRVAACDEFLQEHDDDRFLSGDC